MRNRYQQRDVDLSASGLCKGTNDPGSHFCVVNLKAVNLHVPYVVFVV